MVTEEPNMTHFHTQPNPSQNVTKDETLFSPRLKSAAAMAGWDEETLVIASLIVDDTPVRESNKKKRSDMNFKTPPSNSRRKRRDQRKSPALVPATVLNLDEEIESIGFEIFRTNEKKEAKTVIKEAEREEKKDELPILSGLGDPSPSLPCLDRLREELSCAICLDICFEPSTTSCGHSFCKRCLQSAAAKCGKRCPKCRQLISNGRSCTVNTVLWNTIQLLFPKEIESRKSTKAKAVENPQESKSEISSTRQNQKRLRRSVRPSAPSSQGTNTRRRRGMPSQDEDTALALRLQRDEFLEAFGGRHEGLTSSLSFARLEAMASRATNLRIRSRAI